MRWIPTALAALMASSTVGWPLTTTPNDSVTRRNVLGGLLQTCSTSPLTGYLRDGCCRYVPDDPGDHTVCAEVTAEFLEYTHSQGNDLSSPRPGFSGLRPGDRWCLCASRWAQANRANKAPRVVLAATDVHALDCVSLDELKAHAIDAP